MSKNWLRYKYIIIYLISILSIGPVIGAFVSWNLDFLNPGYWTIEARVAYLIIIVYCGTIIYKGYYLKALKKINMERRKETE